MKPPAINSKSFPKHCFCAIVRCESSSHAMRCYAMKHHPKELNIMCYRLACASFSSLLWCGLDRCCLSLLLLFSRVFLVSLPPDAYALYMQLQFSSNLIEEIFICLMLLYTHYTLIIRLLWYLIWCWHFSNLAKVLNWHIRGEWQRSRVFPHPSWQ